MSIPSIPRVLYGTARGKGQQHTFTVQALKAGYSGFDLAATSEYALDLFVAGVATAVEQGVVTEPQALYVQTKFTNMQGYRGFQAPFNAEDSPAVQVQKSLKHCKLLLGRVDGLNAQAVLLHGLMPTMEETIVYWKELEDQVGENVALGVCNVGLRDFQTLYQAATTKPRIVQNRFCPGTGFDLDLIEYCKANNIIYQAFGLIVSNFELLDTKIVNWYAEQNRVSSPEALYCLLSAYGGDHICLLTGSQSWKTQRAYLTAANERDVDKAVLDGFRSQLINLASENVVPEE